MKKMIPVEAFFAKWRKDPSYVQAYNNLTNEFGLAKAMIRIAQKVEDLDGDTLEAIARSEVAPEYAGLDDLITDWSPRS